MTYQHDVNAINICFVEHLATRGILLMLPYHMWIWLVVFKENFTLKSEVLDNIIHLCLWTIPN